MDLCRRQWSISDSTDTQICTGPTCADGTLPDIALDIVLYLNDGKVDGEFELALIPYGGCVSETDYVLVDRDMIIKRSTMPMTLSPSPENTQPASSQPSQPCPPEPASSPTATSTGQKTTATITPTWQPDTFRVTDAGALNGVYTRCNISDLSAFLSAFLHARAANSRGDSTPFFSNKTGILPKQ